MARKRKHIRLDEILIQLNLISQDQIREALTRQKAHGGRLGSQLLYHRYIDETGLVKALSLQMGTEGVVLSDVDIPEAVIKMLPSRIAVARKVVPFDYDTEANLLKIASEDPRDQSLIDELSFVARGKQIKMFVAAELALNTAIARYYLGREVSLEENLLLDIPLEATDTGEITTNPEDVETQSIPSRPTVMIVSDEEYAPPLLQSLLERDDYDVVMSDSADDAIEMIGDRSFHTVLIKDTVSGDYIDLIDRLRKISPRTTVRYYESSASLLLHQETAMTTGDMLIRDLELMTSLLALKNNDSSNHSGAVGAYVDSLCRKLGLPEKERLTIVNAAYLHDLSRYYYRADSDRDSLSTIKLTVKLLTSLQYPPVVIEILRSMYKDLGGKYTKRLPIEVFGGNILTIVDIFCENIDLQQKLSLDKFDAIKKKYRDLTGKLFLGEVVEAFIALIQDEILQAQTAGTAGQVMIYADDPGILYPVEHRIHNEYFRTVGQCSLDSFVELYQRGEPDIMVLVLGGQKAEIVDTIDRLEAMGISLGNVPTFLLVSDIAGAELTRLLDRGLEDIIDVQAGLDMLVTKMHKVQAIKQAREDQKNDSQGITSETRGRLADMNLIDLLQALGPARRTVRITLYRTDDNERHLLLYLDEGVISFARLGDTNGADAVYEAMSWADGSWLIEPLSADDLPEPNNETANESILMEGCRLMDEKARSGQLL